MSTHTHLATLARHAARRFGLLLSLSLVLWLLGGARPVQPAENQAKFCKVLAQLRLASKTDFKGYIGGKKNPPAFWVNEKSTYFAAKIQMPEAKSSHIEIMALDPKLKFYIYQATFYEAKDTKVAKTVYEKYRQMLVTCMPAEMKMQQDFSDNEGSIMTFKGPGSTKDRYCLVELVRSPSEKLGGPCRVCLRVAEFPVE